MHDPRDIVAGKIHFSGVQYYVISFKDPLKHRFCSNYVGVECTFYVYWPYEKPCLSYCTVTYIKPTRIFRMTTF